jgi:hypothetical protein
MTSRRSLLNALLASPLLALLPALRAKDPRYVARVANIDAAVMADLAHGADCTSVWLINWGDEKPREFTGQYAKWQRRMWLKGRI